MTERYLRTLTSEADTDGNLSKWEQTVGRFLGKLVLRTVIK